MIRRILERWCTAAVRAENERLRGSLAASIRMEQSREQQVYRLRGLLAAERHRRIAAESELEARLAERASQRLEAPSA